MKKYFAPEIQATLITKSDILSGSDLFINAGGVGGLYGEDTGSGVVLSEYTGEPIEQ